jgi:hypothetical protein
MGLDMNTNAQSRGQPLDHKDSISVAPFGTTGGGTGAPIAALASAPFGPGPNMADLTGAASAGSGTSVGLTSWTINPDLDTLSMTLSHSYSGGSTPADNFVGSEGVFYFYALTAGTLSVTYDYADEQVADPESPYKASERGRSKVRTNNNARGLGDETSGGWEVVNRDGSRTFFANVGPGDDLIALQFDFESSGGSPASVNGSLSMSFTPVPEPGSAALLGLGGLGLLGHRRRASLKACRRET